MKYFKKFIRCFQIFIGIIAFIVGFDMLVLHGKLKLLWIAMANTTSSSPFSTDGQSNWMLILIIIAIIIVTYILTKILSNLGNDVEEDDKE